MEINNNSIGYIKEFEEKIESVRCLSEYVELIDYLTTKYNIFNDLEYMSLFLLREE